MWHYTQIKILMRSILILFNLMKYEITTRYLMQIDCILVRLYSDLYMLIAINKCLITKIKNVTQTIGALCLANFHEHHWQT